ncbi:MAG TPA: hypothetical protein VGR52_03800 [Stellaceae bacterium]|nr:hypothetical protein [Stellaceae bacterium]
MIWAVLDLMDGDQQTLKAFVAAGKFWDNFFQDKRKWSVEEFRAWFSKFQVRYEHALPGDDRPFKKRIMALTCLGSLYRKGSEFGDNRDLAVKVAKALLTSDVSLEVKHFAVDVVKLFDLHRSVSRKGRLGEAVSLGLRRPSLTL